MTVNICDININNNYSDACCMQCCVFRAVTVCRRGRPTVAVSFCEHRLAIRRCIDVVLDLVSHNFG